MIEVKHTAFPWTVEDGTTTGKKIVAPTAAKSKRNIAHIGGPDREDNAAFLLRAAQSYESDQAKIAALVEALKLAREFTASELENREQGLIATDDPPEYLQEPKDALSKIDAALKLAEGQS